MSYTWVDYYKNRGTKPRSELREALPYITTGTNALDLGCGAFVESRYMLEKGFSVVAVDPEISLSLYLDDITNDNFTFECVPVQNFDFPKNEFDFVCANYSLPFVTKRKHRFIFDSIYESLRPGGIFAFQLFGKYDQRNVWWRNSLCFHSEDEIMELISKFELVDFDEAQHFTKLAGGKQNFSHVYRVIVKK